MAMGHCHTGFKQEPVRVSLTSWLPCALWGRWREKVSVAHWGCDIRTQPYLQGFPSLWHSKGLIGRSAEKVASFAERLRKRGWPIFANFSDEIFIWQLLPSNELTNGGQGFLGTQMKNKEIWCFQKDNLAFNMEKGMNPYLKGKKESSLCVGPFL